MTLVVSANGQGPETVTFQTADFANIAAATAAEVATKVNAAATGVTAAAGAGNDFFVTGGDGTTAGAGRILVDGWMTLIERGLRYREQPLFENAALALVWGVDQVGSIPTPSVNEVQTVFIDVWHREVARAEDAAIIDPRIDIQTAVSLRREWAVRVVAAANYAATLATKPVGHAYYPLAQLHRSANNASIGSAMLEDVRDTDASLRSEIAFRNTSGLIVVGTKRFRDMLVLTRDSARSFITFLMTKFVAPSSQYLAAEILGIETLSAVANTADQALVAVNAQTLGTRAALRVMQQLYDAEKRLVTVWQSTVLPLVKSGSQVYNATFGDAFFKIKGYLDGPPLGGSVPIVAAIAAADLDGAVTSQEQLAGEIGGLAGKPVGVLALKYLGSQSGQVSGNTPLDLKYEVSGSVTPADDLDVQVFIDPQWATGLKNGDGSTPFALQGGPGDFTRQFFLTVTPPANGQTLYSVEVHARHNSGGLAYLTGQKILKVGDVPPPSEQLYEVRIKNTVLVPSGGEFPVTVNTQETITFRFENHTVQPISIDWTGSTSGTWTITKGTVPANPVAANNGADLTYAFKAPNAPGDHVVFTLTVKDLAATTLAALAVKLVSKAL
jgi:hypothetical protein